jgi:hypothetical protein
MVKVVAPMFSLAASGTINKTFTYVCGLYARRAERAEKMEFSEEQKERQTKYSVGCKEWQKLGDKKKLWNEFAERVKSSGACDANLEFYMTGFQTFMSYFLLRGIGGWRNYPLPPI